MDSKGVFKEYGKEHGPEEIILDFKKSRKISRFLDEISGRDPSSSHRLDMNPDKVEKLKLKDYFKDLDKYERSRKNRPKSGSRSKLVSPNLRKKSMNRKSSIKSISRKNSKSRLSRSKLARSSKILPKHTPIKKSSRGLKSRKSSRNIGRKSS